MPVKSKFIVLSHGRTGSTYVVQELNKHPQIRMLSEIFHDSYDERPYVNGKKWEPGLSSWDFLQENVYDTLPDGILTIGFKLFYFHLPLSDQTWVNLDKDREIAPVVLHRQNIFAGFVSEERARQSNIWHPTEKGDAYTQEVHVTLNMVKAQRYLDRNFERQKFGLKLVADRNHLFMTYEDLVKDAPGTMKKLANYFKIDVGTWEPAAFLTGSADKSRTIIDNIDEIATFLKQRDAIWMLEPYL